VWNRVSDRSGPNGRIFAGLEVSLPVAKKTGGLFAPAHRFAGEEKLELTRD
jgi:hypothetical protein